MIATALFRFRDGKTPVAIIRSLRDNAIYSEEMGMYWKEMYEREYRPQYVSPIEIQTIMTEAFDEITHDTAIVEDLKTWLIKNRQTSAWGTGKATVDACYALLICGRKSLDYIPGVVISVGDTQINPEKAEGHAAGTGYFSKTWYNKSIKTSMSDITVTNSGNNVCWGGAYIQYFESIDKVQQHDSPLGIVKNIFVNRDSKISNNIILLDTAYTVSPGDRLTIRLTLRTDRDMEYVYIKDMRPSGLEPLNMMSGYRRQDGLSYYEDIKDASVNYFIPYLRKGTWVLEYRLSASHPGEFTSGIATVQCMYAPEFSAHSDGTRIRIR